MAIEVDISEETLTEYRATIIKARQFWDELVNARIAGNGYSELHFQWVIEDIDQYIKHEIHGLPYDDDEDEED